jgi:hypothetical protein
MPPPPEDDPCDPGIARSAHTSAGVEIRAGKRHSEPAGTHSGVRLKDKSGRAPNGATVDEVVANRKRDPRYDDE